MRLNLRFALVLLAWVLAALLLLPGLRRLDTMLRPVSPVAGTESALVDSRLATEFDSPFTATALLVLSGVPALGADTAAWRASVRAVVTALAAAPGVTGILSPATSLDTLLASRDGRTVIVVVGAQRVDVIDSLRVLTQRSLPQWRTGMPQLTARWTGLPAVIEDLRRAGISATRQAEWRALPVMAVVALWALGAAGTALALLAAALVIVVAFGAVGTFGGLFPPALIIRILVPLVGLALTVDYTLYLRYRARDGVPRHRARRTVTLAAAVVAFAFGALALTPTGELQAAARAGILVAALSAMAAVTVTARQGPAPVAALHSKRRRGRSSRRWLAWGRIVTTRPWLMIAIAALPLALLGWHARTARLETPLTGWLPPAMESTGALRDLERGDRAGLIGALRVLVELPAGAPALSPRGWAIVRRETTAIAAMPGVAAVRSLTSIGTGDLTVAQHVLPAAVRNTYASRDGRLAVIDVVPDLRGGDAAATRLVQRIRGSPPAPDAALLVGGLPAYVADFAASIRRALPYVIAATTLATVLVLAATLRAPVLVLKAVTLNLLVAAAAIGATVLVYQDGVVARLLHVAAPGAVLPTVPVLAFGAVFGLSMDYELFLLSGVLEAKREGLEDTAAIVTGLARTGPLITRAAAIMVTLFVAFATSSLVPLAMIGFALAVAVALDATIVRLVLAPALLCVLGRWNWWPGTVLRS
ncbi:MAG: MMPL family transporter [Gemmatimonadales bacterium]